MSLNVQTSNIPVETQPNSIFAAPPGSVSPDAITVRNLKDTAEDAEFAARLNVDGFRGKYVHNITVGKLPIAIRNQTACHRGQNQAFYNRTFVAEISGHPVGLLQLKFKGDNEIEIDDHVNEMGCWHAFRYKCYRSETTADVANSFECYLDHICVDGSARGKGVGKVLMQKAENEARARNCSMIYLYVMTNNRARNLYERQGYSVTANHRCLGCFLGPPGSVFRMEKRLD